MMVTAAWLLLGIAVSTSAFSMRTSLESNCTASEFACRNGNCVPPSSRCNENNDCGDGSDEELCELILCKEPAYFRCKNQRCISKSFVCDGEDDCADFSDEDDCSSEVSKPVICNESQWQCADKKLCIPNEWVCNGAPDCSDHSDEVIGCSSNIGCNGSFKCKNDRCIPNAWVCDGEHDCADNSDEQDCAIPVSTTMFPEVVKKNHLNGKGAEQRETLDKLLSICLQRRNMEQTQFDELHSIRMQVEEENLKAAKLRVQVAELQIRIEETKLKSAKLDI